MEMQGSLSDGAVLLQAQGLEERTISGWVRRAQDFNLREFSYVRISSVRKTGCARLLDISNKGQRLRKQEMGGEFLLEETDRRHLFILKYANERLYLKQPLKNAIKIQIE